MKKLADLNPEWTGVKRPNSGEGMTFDCPACGPRHRLAVYFVNPKDGGDILPRPNTQMWTRYGDDLAMVVIAPSVDYGCWHGWVERGWVFDVSEAPVVVPVTDPDGQVTKLVGLSPMQAVDYGNIVMANAQAMLDGKKPMGRVEVSAPKGGG